MMKQYIVRSSLIHGAVLLVFFLFPYLSPTPTVYWLDGFDFAGGGGGTGPGGRGGIKKEQMGQTVPQPEKVALPEKPAPVQPETKAAESWKIKEEKGKTITPVKPVRRVPKTVETGAKAQKAQSNVISRGVKEGETAGTGGFDFGPGDGGRGKGVGIGIGPGTGGGGFGFGSYLRILRARIWDEWYQSSVFGQNKTCIVALTVYRDGHVSDIKLEKSSNDSFYDDVARRAVRNASPLPPLPPNFPKSKQRFRLEFRLID